MSCRILHDHESDRACLFDSVTDSAFGPIFKGGEPFDDAQQEAQAFIDWLDKHPAENRRYSVDFRSDPRAYGDGELIERYAEFRREVDEGKVVADA